MDPLIRHNADDLRKAAMSAAGDFHIYVYSAGSYTYVCETDQDSPLLASAIWRIRRIKTATGADQGTIQYADGNRNFDNVATAPAALTYPAFA